MSPTAKMAAGGQHDAERLGGVGEDGVQGGTAAATIIATRKPRNMAAPPP